MPEQKKYEATLTICRIRTDEAVIKVHLLADDEEDAECLAHEIDIFELLDNHEWESGYSDTPVCEIDEVEVKEVER